jgi:effector-binding domain-containing protein
VPLAVIRRQARADELARLVPEYCGRVWKEIQAQQAAGGRHVAVYWDRAIRLEVGVELQGGFEERGDVVRSATPAGLVASTTHFGPYGGLTASHQALKAWCETTGHRLAGPSWEIYGHWLSEWNSDPSRIRTDIFYLLARES